MKNSLIIKTGALGDVVRTTCLLNELDGKILWLTSQGGAELLPRSRISKIYVWGDFKRIKELTSINFDLIISLEEDIEILKFIRGLNYKKLIGLFLDDNLNIDYTIDSEYWFDMSLTSKKFDLEKANRIKLENEKSVPQILIEMVGRRWVNQPYILDFQPSPERKSINRIGLIDVSDSKWPNKLWDKYSLLKKILFFRGYEVISLEFKKNLIDHVEDINKCDLIICGDTLGLHLALALKKRIIALFTCTPPNEIYGYGGMVKIINKNLKRDLFKREVDQKIRGSISLEEVLKELDQLLNLYK